MQESDNHKNQVVGEGGVCDEWGKRKGFWCGKVSLFHQGGCYKVVHLIVHYIIGLFYQVSICVLFYNKEREKRKRKLHLLIYSLSILKSHK